MLDGPICRNRLKESLVSLSGWTWLHCVKNGSYGDEKSDVECLSCVNVSLQCTTKMY